MICRTAATFDVALRGVPAEPFAVQFLFVHHRGRTGGQEEPIEAQFELSGVVSTVGYSQTVELSYDGTSADGAPSLWVDPCIE